MLAGALIFKRRAAGVPRCGASLMVRLALLPFDMFAHDLGALMGSHVDAHALQAGLLRWPVPGSAASPLYLVKEKKVQ